MHKEYAGSWYTWGDDLNNKQYGILTEDNNELTFKTQHRDKLFHAQFIGICDSRNIRVYTYTQIDAYDGFGYYRVKKAVLHNCNDLNELSGDEIDNIVSASFSIRGFSEWYGKSGLEVTATEDNYFTALQKKQDMFYVYKGKDFDIVIYFKRNFPPTTMDWVGNIITLENSPHIGIMYHYPVTDSELLSHMRIIYRFFALLIGRLGYIDDIWFNRQGDSLPYQLLINEDITYNINSKHGFPYKHRINFDKIKDKLQVLFDKWLSFSTDELFAFLLNNYFHLYKNKSFILEDYFLTCCKFLEGYSIRKYGDIDKELEKRLEKEIRPLFQNDKTNNEPTHVKKALEEIFTREKIKYSANKISRAISHVLTNNKTLESRFDDLDSEFFNIITQNEKSILESSNTSKRLVEGIVATRNYYSHFKSDKTNILTMQQIYECNDVLLALITSVLFSEIGYIKSDILELLKHDTDFWTVANKC